jgi:hypothetical protein
MKNHMHTYVDRLQLLLSGVDHDPLNVHDKSLELLAKVHHSTLLDELHTYVTTVLSH